MSEDCSHRDVLARSEATRCRGVSDKLFVGLMLLTLVRTSEALAGEQAGFPGAALRPDLNAPPQRIPLSIAMVPIPSMYQAMDLPEIETLSTQEFRPRGRSVAESEARLSASDDAPMIRGSTVWQRLSEYRSHGRVRLLTLWETGGSSISLQAGKKGDPSLQWTSGLNRGGATRGLFDRFFAISLAGAARGIHFSPRSSGAEPSGKQAKLMDVGVGGAK